jgi:hypothetical protein
LCANNGEWFYIVPTLDEATAAPEYSEDKPIVVLGATGKLQPLRFDP